MKCTDCVLLRDPSTCSPEQFGEQIAECDECPHLEGPAANEAAVALTRRYDEILRMFRRTRSKHLQAASELAEVLDESKTYQDKLERLQHVHRAASTEIDRIDAQLRETTAQLIQTEKLTALGELSAGVAHELNQPLNNMKILVQSRMREIQKSRYDMSDLSEEDAELLRHVDRMANIIDHMRIFTRKPEDKPNARVDVNAAIEGALSFVRNQLQGQDIQLDVVLSSGLPDLIGDPNTFEQVVLNFLTNARDAVAKQMAKDEGHEGRITVRSFMLHDAALCVDVEDNGSGVDPNIRGKIFDPFFTTKEVGSGTGLGLSIARRIVMEYGGKIEFEERDGGGATFRAILPVAE